MIVARVQRSEPYRAENESFCLACSSKIDTGAWCVRVPLGPGADPDRRALVRNGFEFEAITVPCHHGCVTGWSTPDESAAERRAIYATALKSEIERYVTFQNLSSEEQARQVAVAAIGLRDPSFDTARYVEMCRTNIKSTLKFIDPSMDPEKLVAEYGGSW